jgi:hypothetical protein
VTMPIAIDITNTVQVQSRRASRSPGPGIRTGLARRARACRKGAGPAASIPNRSPGYPTTGRCAGSVYQG